MKKKIMLVDDEKIIAEDVWRALKGLGYEVSEIIPRGDMAIERAGEYMPDLVLMDIKLDGEMDGTEVAKIIREKYDIPIIYLTAYADDKIIADALESSPFGYLVKPFEDRELNATIKMAFYKVEMERKQLRRKDFLLSVINTVPNSIYARDINGKYVIVNSNFAELINLKPQQIIGKTDAELELKIQNSMKDFPLSRFEDISVIEEKSIVEIPEERLIKHDGTIQWFRTTKVPLKSPDGVNLTLGVSVDITEQKNIKDELMKSNTRLQDLLEETVNGLISALEMRDPYTAGHQKRVAMLATAIATKMELPENLINGIRIAASLHDIGKINIPAEILSKPVPLTKVEYSLIQSHSQAGYDILSKINFPWPIADIVLQHHERIDGSGYPQGLKQDEIILEAKILNVADVVEAISSNRPYRPAKGIDKAIAEIKKNINILYDEEISNVCIKLFEENEFEFVEQK